MMSGNGKNCVNSASKSVVLLAGVSGAGKSTVLSILEDQGFFCIENLPLFLLEETLAYVLSNPQYKQNIVVSLAPHAFLGNDTYDVKHFEEKYRVHLAYWYIEASRNVLIKRYDETRRRHPFSDKSTTLEHAIDTEFTILESYASIADYTLDTTNLSLQELREIVCQKLLGKDKLSSQLKIFSFGFKYGMPQKADYLFDVRSLPNPYWDKRLRLQTGLDVDVIEYLQKQPQVLEMIADISKFLLKWCELQQQQGKSYIDIAVGCTGGQHRSVYIVEQLADQLRASFNNVIVSHRELKG
ncbi:RNase adapter protein RapZ [Cysteiniphilum litorale]|uniref:RNase adapter protein RapZ n=1 Tax=Cysteiniphilum litorale TaxID=2056700 RepID=A0A8J2Z500_9GAMM|nr:RNase adapter protein RapZ [Cysteiniphilum litorale]